MFEKKIFLFNNVLSNLQVEIFTHAEAAKALDFVIVENFTQPSDVYL